MMLRAASLAILAAAGMWAQSGADARRDPNKLRAWFADGSGVEFSTEATGSTAALSSTGSMVANEFGILRLVVDDKDVILYAYGVEAWAGQSPDTVTIRVKPFDPKTADLMRERQRRQRNPSFQFPERPVPTLATAREFPALKKGEAVRLEILSNPSTGEKVYDVLRPTTGSKPSPRTLLEWPPEIEEISLRDIAIAFDGQSLKAPGGWLTGATARLYVPGHGAYFLATYQPNPPPVFRHMAYADGRNLEFAVDGDDIRIASKSNVLTLSGSGILWIYHDPKYQPSSHPEAADLVFADRIESLLPTTKR